MYQIDVKTSGKAYPIYIESGLMSRIPEMLKAKYEGRKLAIVSDNKVFGLYGGALVIHLSRVGFEVVTFSFPEGEQNKNIETLTKIYQMLADNAFTRSDIVVALGGGVTGDMAGLAAATFLRGLGFIQIPTTLLAMVDSSIGGKVAVDLPQGKNLIGAFYQPDAVLTDPGLLKTLDARRFSDGMAELIKHGFIFDLSLCHQLENYKSRTDITPHLDQIIMRSCDIKRRVVEQDECDNGIRQILNFGHTLGHAIEKVENFIGHSHGEAISVGMVFMTRISEKMGLTQVGTAAKVKALLEQYGLPTSFPDINTSELLNALRIDKKARSGQINIVYIPQIGESRLLGISFEELEGKVVGELSDRTQ